MSHSFSHDFYMPEGSDPYDVVACPDDYPTTLGEALLAMQEREPEEWAELCERADVYPSGELAWHDVMTWVREEVNCVTDRPHRTVVYTSTGDGMWDSIDVYSAEGAADARRLDAALVSGVAS